MHSFARRLLTIAGAVALTATAAGAQLPLQYSTTGSFNGGTNSITIGLSTLTFTGLIDQSTKTPNVSYGEIKLVSTNTTGYDDFTGVSFVLNLTQTVPTGGTGVFTGALVGTVESDASGATINFTTDNFNIGSLHYTIQNPTLVVSPTTNSGVTTLQGTVTTPEPASMTLLATGLIGVFGAARRRRQAKTDA